MRKVILSEYLSLDGVMGEPSWTVPYWSDEIGRYKFEELFSSDALLLGRVTYEGFAAAWPSMKDEQGFADRMNGLPKWVATTTLTEFAWNNARRIDGDVAAALAALKGQDGQNILIYGSAALARALRQHGLIDEYRLMIHPVVLGAGKRLFQEGAETTALKLVDTQTFDSGVVVLTYAPAEGA
jgi:dihydrofolate reductase